MELDVTPGINGTRHRTFSVQKEHLSMRISITAVYAAAVFTSAALVSGCSGAVSSSSFAPSGTTPQGASQTGSGVRSRDGSLHYYFLPLDSLGGAVSFAINIDDFGQASGTSLLGSNTLLHAQNWEHPPRTKDLGTLGGPNSAIFQYNHGLPGQFVGWSETSQTDPNDENFCGFGTSHVCLGFSWQHGKLKSLPTLGGTNDNTNDVNWRGQISGAAETSTKDPSCTPPHVLDYLGVIWQPNGKITTLPPYSGDSVSYAYTITQSGQDVVGNSGSCSSPATHAVLWHNAAPISLGGLGGSVNLALDVNDWGQVIGNSDLAGNAVTHTFLWQNGTMRDLGTLPGDLNSFAGGINDEGQVVGQSCDASGNCRGYLWQNGTMTDLNTLIAPSQGLNVLFGANINDLGEIVGATVNQQGLEQGFLLVPDGMRGALRHGASESKVVPSGKRLVPRPRGELWDLRKRAIPR